MGTAAFISGHRSWLWWARGILGAGPKAGLFALWSSRLWGGEGCLWVPTTSPWVRMVLPGPTEPHGKELSTSESNPSFHKRGAEPENALQGPIANCWPQFTHPDICPAPTFFRLTTPSKISITGSQILPEHKHLEQVTRSAGKLEGPQGPSCSWGFISDTCPIKGSCWLTLKTKKLMKQDLQKEG